MSLLDQRKELSWPTVLDLLADCLSRGFKGPGQPPSGGAATQDLLEVERSGHVGVLLCPICTGQTSLEDIIKHLKSRPTSTIDLQMSILADSKKSSQELCGSLRCSMVEIREATWSDVKLIQVQTNIDGRLSSEGLVQFVLGKKPQRVHQTIREC